MLSWSIFFFFFFLLIIILIPIKVLFNYCIIIYTYIISYVSMALWCGIDDNWQLFAEVGMASDGYLFLQWLKYFLFKGHTVMTWQRLEPRPLSPESDAKTTLPYMLTPFIVKTEKKILYQKEKVIVITFLSTMLDL